MKDAAVLVSLSESGADDARMDSLTRQVRDELRQLDVRDVRPAPADTPPPDGSRGVDVGAFGQLMVAMMGAQGLAGLMTTLLAWLGRGQEAPRTVRVELDGDVLELSGASSEEQAELVALFLNKHATEV